MQHTSYPVLYQSCDLAICCQFDILLICHFSLRWCSRTDSLKGDHFAHLRRCALIGASLKSELCCTGSALFTALIGSPLKGDHSATTVNRTGWGQRVGVGRMPSGWSELTGTVIQCNDERLTEF